MTPLSFTLIGVLATVAIWQLIQRRSHDQKLTDLKARLAQRAAGVVAKPHSTVLPPRPSRSPSSLENPLPKPAPAPDGKLTLSETLTTFGETLGPSTRRLMELRDQLPNDERVPFDDIFKLVASVNELNISDIDLKTELIQEAEMVMRTMIGTLTSIPPEDAIILSTKKGDVNMTPFILGYVGSALL